MAAMTPNASNTLLSTIQNIVTKGRADASNAKFSFRFYVPDANYPNQWKTETVPSATVVAGGLCFTVAASSEAAAATEAQRIYNLVQGEFAPQIIDISNFRAGQIWTING